ncbi:alcohol dehydrogenase, putative [Bodo saltans]|uniref:Alcohol dehydrogenase, putative n=1 Tax=Bodo saltans TaxID=75058 RepID=A0A0S4IT20_BODSA|nr:alcohol dehydrogenase, putative [Bodo saltans]|eukprot:CUF10902.1 alcohol dehydrogenase, putative [Bodo saltans]
MSLPKMYRALQLAQPGSIDQFQLAQRALRLPKSNEVLVKVAGCAIAYRDVLDRKGAFKFIQRPTVLGHEFSGTVVAAGSDVRSLKEGNKVVSVHWDQDAAWPSPLKAAGAVDSMFGLTCDGGYAEYVVARAGAFATAPESISLVDASCLVSTFGTVWHACVTKAGLKKGDTIAVTGVSGGVGSAMALVAKALGCTVIGVTSSADKVEAIRATTKCDDVVVAINGKYKLSTPVDQVLEAVGGPTFTSSLRALKPGGALVLIGNVENSVCDLPLGYCILNSIRIIGSDSIPINEFNNEFVPFFDRNGLKPWVQEYVSLEGIPHAHQALEGKNARGRIIADLSLLK